MSVMILDLKTLTSLRQDVAWCSMDAEVDKSTELVLSTVHLTVYKTVYIMGWKEMLEIQTQSPETLLYIGEIIQSDK